MLRLALLCSLALAVVTSTTACRKDREIIHPENEGPPPLPPASGTAVGYLIDHAGELKLRDDQRVKLKEIDDSLQARNDVIDTQLRQIERPAEEEQQKGQPPPRHNNAPGAQIVTTPDAAKLHQARKDNDREALGRAFAVLDAEQQKTAKRLLEDRGITAPGGDAKPQPSAQEPPPSETGVPHEP